MSTFKLTIVTPEREILSQDVLSFSCESQEGEFEILEGHESSLIVVVPNTIKIKDKNSKTSKIFVSSGLLKVKENQGTLCVDIAQWPKDIDVSRANAARERAEQRLLSNDRNIDIKRAEAALARAIARIKTVEN